MVSIGHVRKSIIEKDPLSLRGSDFLTDGHKDVNYTANIKARLP